MAPSRKRRNRRRIFARYGPAVRRMLEKRDAAGAFSGDASAVRRGIRSANAGPILVGARVMRAGGQLPPGDPLRAPVCACSKGAAPCRYCSVDDVKPRSIGTVRHGPAKDVPVAGLPNEPWFIRR